MDLDLKDIILVTDLYYILFLFINFRSKYKVIKLSGAEEACSAHNREDNRSKLF